MVAMPVLIDNQILILKKGPVVVVMLASVTALTLSQGVAGVVVGASPRCL